MQTKNLSATAALLALALAGAGCNQGGGGGTGSKTTAASTAATTMPTGTTPTATTPTGTTPFGQTPSVPSPLLPTASPSPAPAPVGPRPVSRWVYVPNIGDDTISQYSVDATTGALAPVNAPVSVPAGSEPDYLATDPANKFVFCALPGNSGQIMTFQVNPNTGTLNPGTVANAGVGCNACTVDPTGTLLLVSNEFGDSISSFTIDPTTGTLGAPQTVSVPTSSMPSFVAIDPSGKFAYSANYQTNNVSVISIEAGTGKLAVVGSPVPCGTTPFVLATDPSGDHLFVGCSAAISTFDRDQATGALTPMGSGSVAISTLGGVVGMAIDPAGKFLYVSCGTTAATGSVNTMNTFAIDTTTSALTEVTPATLLGSSTLPFFMGLDNSATFAFAPDYDNNVVLSFKADPVTGDLTASGTPVATGGSPGAALAIK